METFLAAAKPAIIATEHAPPIGIWNQSLKWHLALSNERSHSQAKDANNGGFVQQEWGEVRDIAKAGLLAALAPAFTSQNIAQSEKPKMKHPERLAENRKMATRTHLRQTEEM